METSSRDAMAEVFREGGERGTPRPLYVDKVHVWKPIWFHVIADRADEGAKMTVPLPRITVALPRIAVPLHREPSLTGITVWTAGRLCLSGTVDVLEGRAIALTRTVGAQTRRGPNTR